MYSFRLEYALHKLDQIPNGRLAAIMDFIMCIKWQTLLDSQTITVEQSVIVQGRQHTDKNTITPAEKGIMVAGWPVVSIVYTKIIIACHPILLRLIHCTVWISTVTLYIYYCNITRYTKNSEICNEVTPWPKAVAVVKEMIKSAANQHTMAKDKTFCEIKTKPQPSAVTNYI